VAVFSVATSPFDSITTKRPLAEISLANDATCVVAEARLEFVICVAYASGVEDDVDCADDESAPTTSMQAAAAHTKAITSLIIKKPKFYLKCDSPCWV